ncbi:MAG TPA: dolichyl-phosphate beta-glucosyltransferase [Solirubrobacteraceae bacterium]|nr:dolichyl-phosphate beta-glucosyltransferase [Solirubrobacteraceae bacterium]
MTTPAAAPPTEARRPAGPAGLPVRRLDVDIVVPVHNEAGVLDASVRTLHGFLEAECDFTFRITIADNASTDETLEIARRLSGELAGVDVLHLDRKGRGLALRAAWGRSEATVVAYTDVDLSTDLAALPALVGPLLDGHGDLAIGSRLAAGAEVTRGVKREVISRTYNILLRILLDVGFSDAQCGFKAARRDVVVELLPEVENDRWFFDTELLYVAQRRKFSIREVPVRWVDDPDSRVAIAATVREDLQGIARLRRRNSHRRRPSSADRNRPVRRRQVLHVGRQSN